MELYINEAGTSIFYNEHQYSRHFVSQRFIRWRCKFYRRNLSDDGSSRKCQGALFTTLDYMDPHLRYEHCNHPLPTRSIETFKAVSKTTAMPQPFLKPKALNGLAAPMVNGSDARTLRSASPAVPVNSNKGTESNASSSKNGPPELPSPKPENKALQALEEWSNSIKNDAIDDISSEDPTPTEDRSKLKRRKLSPKSAPNSDKAFICELCNARCSTRNALHCHRYSRHKNERHLYIQRDIKTSPKRPESPKKPLEVKHRKSASKSRSESPSKIAATKTESVKKLLSIASDISEKLSDQKPVLTPKESPVISPEPPPVTPPPVTNGDVLAEEPAVETNATEIPVEDDKVEDDCASPESSPLSSSPEPEEAPKTSPPKQRVAESEETDVSSHSTTDYKYFKLDLFACNLCGKTFLKKSSLKSHMGQCKRKNKDKPTKATQFSCCFCSKAFLYKSNVSRHIKRTHIKEFEAIIGSSANVTDVSAANATTDPSEKENDDMSDFLPSPQQSNQVSSKMYSCHLCHKSFCSPSNVRRHLKLKQCQKRFSKNPLRNIIGKSGKFLGKSLQQSKVQAPIKLDVKKLTTNRLQNRQILQRGLLANTCPYCKKKYSSKKCVLRHIKSSHSEESGKPRPKSYSCSICNVQFSSNWSLTRHARRTGHTAAEEKGSGKSSDNYVEEDLKLLKQLTDDDNHGADPAESRVNSKGVIKEETSIDKESRHERPASKTKLNAPSTFRTTSDSDQAGSGGSRSKRKRSSAVLYDHTNLLNNHQQTPKPSPKPKPSKQADSSNSEDSKDQMKSHLKNGKSGHRCKLCNKLYAVSDELVSHYQNMHTVKNLSK